MSATSNEAAMTKQKPTPPPPVIIDADTWEKIQRQLNLPLPAEDKPAKTPAIGRIFSKKPPKDDPARPKLSAKDRLHIKGIEILGRIKPDNPALAEREFYIGYSDAPDGAPAMRAGAFMIDPRNFRGYVHIVGLRNPDYVVTFEPNQFHALATAVGGKLLEWEERHREAIGEAFLRATMTKRRPVGPDD